MKRKSLLILSCTLLLIVSLVGTVSADLPGEGWWTAFVVQNLDSSNTATVSASAYEMQGGSSTEYTFSDTLSPLANKTWHPGFCGSAGLFPCLTNGGSELPAGFAGSAVLSSDQQIAAAVQVGNNEQGGVGTPGGTASAQYNGSSVGSPTLGFPIVKHNYGGKTTTFYIQATTSDVTVTATYATNDGASHTQSNVAISAYRTYVFDPAAAGIASSNCGTNANVSPCVGAVTFTATGGDIVGTVVEHQHSANPATVAQSTAIFASSAATDQVYCPVYKYNWNGRYTGVTVQNTGTSAATVTVSALVIGGGSGSYESTVTINPGKSYVFYPIGSNIGSFPANAYGSVVIEGSNGNDKLVASVNESNLQGVLRQTTYGCFSAENATAQVSAPIFKEDFGGTGSRNRTGLVVQNVGSSSTSVTAMFTCNVSGATQTYTHDAVSLTAGQGFTYYLPSQFGDWQGSSMPAGVLCAVTLNATGNVPIVAIAQEAPTPNSGTDLDIKNYEGFNTAP